MRSSPRTTGLALTSVVALGALSACASTVAPPADSAPGATGRFAQAANSRAPRTPPGASRFPCLSRTGRQEAGVNP